MKDLDNKKFDIFSKVPETLASAEKQKTNIEDKPTEERLIVSHTEKNEFIRPQITQNHRASKFRTILNYLILALIAYLLAQGLSYWLQKKTQDTAQKETKFSAFEVKGIESDKKSTTDTSLDLKTDSSLSITTTTTTTKTTTSVDKSSFVVRILNGNGVAGDAKKYQDQLTSTGFNVGKIGNATKQDYETGIIYYLVGNKSKAETLKSSFTDKTFTLEEETISLIGSGYDILVVLGSK